MSNTRGRFVGLGILTVLFVLACASHRGMEYQVLGNVSEDESEKVIAFLMRERATDASRALSIRRANMIEYVVNCDERIFVVTESSDQPLTYTEVLDYSDDSPTYREDGSWGPPQPLSVTVRHYPRRRLGW